MRRAILPATAAVAVLAAAGAAAGAATPSVDGPRNLRAEAASGDTQAMLAVVSEWVGCLRAKGYDPGDAEVRGTNVVITDWNPGWNTPAWHAEHECAFPDR
jgi:hypothetical protein